MSYSSGLRSVVGEGAVWLLVGLVAATGLYYKSEIVALVGGSTITPHRTAEAPASPRIREPETDKGFARVSRIRADQQGHFFTRAFINDRPVDVMIDTGATIVALTYEAAREAGLRLSDRDFTHSVNTANGKARVAPVTLDRITIGDITLRNIRAAVSEPGKLQTTLLGMSFLKRLKAVSIQGGVLVLEE
ncbi:MAG: TIGR02281 family clan AA aspartic protease [Hyphomicrobiaceae bacterium]|nr:TIGR02281 family clan AA aspartic protease [Hyphomicrobiaceae bacterium]